MSKNIKNIAIFRQAKISQISTLNHLLQEMSKDNLVNKNNKTGNVVWYHDTVDTFKKVFFERDGSNNEIIETIKEYEKAIDKHARNDYQEHKEAEKDKIFAECKKNGTKPPKIRTVLQTKNLKKEFVIAIGGDKNVDNQEFYDNAIKTVKAVIKKKGLEDKNILSIVVHFEETTPHLHCQYLDYSFKHKTTASELERVRPGVDMSREEKKAQYALNCEKFGNYQDLVAENMEMERGVKGSRAKNKSKPEYYQELKEMLKRLNEEISKQNLLRDANKKTIDDQQQIIENNENIINEKTKRVSLGCYALNKLIDGVAKKIGLSKNETIEVLSSFYNQDKNSFKNIVNEANKKLEKNIDSQQKTREELTIGG
jgi:hypothetical protein